MKKQSIVLLMVLFVIVLAFTSCDAIGQHISSLHEHKWVEATCTTPKICSICNKIGSEALGHAEEVLEGKEATCTETGLTEGKMCSACNEVLIAQEIIPVKAHTEVIVAGKEATCTEAGFTESKSCSVCGLEILAQTTIDALGHDMSEATCDEASVCKRENCGHTEGEKLGHSYDEGTVTTNPGCESEGVKLISCTREGCDHSYEEKIDATGHEYTDTVVAPTCIEKGYTLHVCGTCGNSYKDSETDLVEHTYVGSVTTEPGCETTGIKTFTCSVDGCGNSYTEVLSANGHSEIAHESKAASCTEIGWEAYVTCENCDYTTYKEISATGHNGGKATCSAQAVCDDCGENYGDYDLVNGHNYGEADCDSPASCTICGKTTGQAVGHADLNPVDHKCDRCQKVLSEHIDENGDHKCDNGCSEAIGTCEDADLDHDCDYGCDKYFGEHIDDNKDHACDYGCLEAIGDHADGDDANHTCDYGCNNPVAGEACVDEDRDHCCDECLGNVGGECQDDKDAQDNDHLCDYCNKPVDEDCYGGTATCTEKAVCAECGQEYGEILNHSYGDAVYTWSEDNSTCTATIVCGNDSSHVISESATVITVTLNLSGEKVTFTYNVEFANDAFAAQSKTVDGEMTVENKIATVNAPAIAGRVASHDYVKFSLHNAEETHEFTIFYSELDVWDGTSVSESLEGSGTAEDPYLIQSAADFAYFAGKLNAATVGSTQNFSGQYYKMTKSIDLNGNLLIAGNHSAYNKHQGFGGTFDGNNCTIRGINVEPTTGTSSALFGCITKAGTIKNLIVYGNAKGDVTVGGVVAYLLGTAENITSYVTVNGTSTVGGVVANAESGASVVSNCVNYGVVTGSSYIVGGITGSGGHNITNCTNWAVVSGADVTGGISGTTKASGSISGCYNYGTINASGKSGGIVGSIMKPITNCVNYGDVNGTWALGGIAGYVDKSKSASISGCTNNGNVNGKTTGNGGILGLSEWEAGSVSIDNCTNNGNVTATWGGGGIAGDTRAPISNSTNNGNISGSGELGGIVGKAYGEISACTNNGNITATTDIAGGICGSATAAITGCENKGIITVNNCNNPKLDQITASDVTKTDCVSNGSTVIGDHTLTHTDAKDATCEAEGNVAYDNCSVCGKNFDAEGKLLESVVVPAGHKDNDGDFKCDVCEAGLCDHTPDEAVKENEKAATCTVAGSYDNVVYCSKCKSELSRDVIAVDALGHDMQDTVEGTVKTYTCENGCGETYVKYLVTVNHLNLDGSVAAEADVYEFDNETIYTVNAKTIEGYVASHDYVKGYILSEGGSVNIYYSQVDVWDGTSVSESLSGSGTEEDPYLIQSGADLAYLKSIVDAATSYSENPCSGQYFKMTKSIDLNGANFMIGYHSAWNNYDGFAGIFDGNNCSIRGMAIDVASGSAGLFGCIKDTGTLKNLSVYGSVKGTAVAGGAVAYARGTVENVTNYATVVGGSTVGGVAGDVSAVNITYIGNCVNYGDVVATANYAGGVAGSGGSQMTACANFGKVNGVTYVGGICGQTKTVGTIKECNNYGTVEGTSSVDGIAGLAKKTLENCNNYGTVTAG